LQATTALTGAIDVWRSGAACAPLRFVVGKTNVDVVGDDAVNVVVFRQRTWCKDGADRPGSCYDPRRAAVTTLHWTRMDRKGHEWTGEDPRRPLKC
jgi:hypothetical protein